MSLDKKFDDACERIRNFKKRPSDGEMLEIYGLYKQATIGDNNISVKSADATVKAKWEAWNEMKGLNCATAKERYIAKVLALAPKYEK